MQKKDGNVVVDKNNKIINEERGFTERSLNILLQKIVDIESKQTVNKKEVVPVVGVDSMNRKALPLIKTMYIRDPTKKKFNVVKYDHEELLTNNDLYNEAFGDIIYDDLMEMKPHLYERYMTELEEFFEEERQIIRQEMERAFDSNDPSYKLFMIKKC